MLFIWSRESSIFELDLNNVELSSRRYLGILLKKPLLIFIFPFLLVTICDLLVFYVDWKFSVTLFMFFAPLIESFHEGLVFQQFKIKIAFKITTFIHEISVYWHCVSVIIIHILSVLLFA